MNDSELKEINDTVDETAEKLIEEAEEANAEKVVEEAKEAASDTASGSDSLNKKDSKADTGSKSHSREKREKRRKEVAQARRKAKTAAIAGYICLAAVAALLVWGIVVLVGRQLDKVVPNENYSDGLEANGYITGVTASDKVTLPDYKNITVPYEEIRFTDEEIDTEIENLMTGYDSLNTEAGNKVEDGDDVEIAYVGTIDGVAFDGGTSDSYKLNIGSGTFIEGFEEQLIGAEVGSTVEVNVTFPEDYQNADVAGKDALFTVDVNGIYEDAVFDDAFVAENLSDKATTAEGYRDYVRSTHEDENLETYLKDYMIENSTVSSYPSKYVKILKGIQMYDDEQSYEYMNQFYQNYYGSSAYDSFESYIGTTMTEYYQTLKDKAKDTCKENLIWQAVVEKEGATADADYYRAKLVEDGQTEEYYDTLVTTSGEPFILQQAIAAKALEIVKNGASIERTVAD